RLGLRYVSGLRQEVGKSIASVRSADLRGRTTTTDASADLKVRTATTDVVQAFRPAGEICPKCGCDDPSMIEPTDRGWFCNICSNDWKKTAPGSESLRRFRSLDELIARTGLRRDEVVTLADIGALNAFGYDRRSALWQAERAVRPDGELFTTINQGPQRGTPQRDSRAGGSIAELAELAEQNCDDSNLQ